ncbi:FUSC family protein [Actinospica robiniae]|uniref:FUSC family protein n=1 Tax=Actinospica robiniae TaxID=304901 RepID=UPI00042647EF|nr:FUSC family protein [Actinospica robiniae]
MVSKLLSSGGRCPTCRPSRLVGVRDRVQAGDPALARLRSGWRMLMVFPATLAAGYAMARAMGQPGLIGLTFGGMLGLICGLSIAGPKPGKVALRCVWGVPAMLLAMFCAIEIHPYRVPGLIAGALALGVQLALTSPRLAEFWRDSGTLFFSGFLGGLLAPMPVEQLKYIAPITGVAGVAAGGIQAIACRTRPASGFENIERGYLFRVRTVVQLARQLVADSGTKNLARKTLKLNAAMVRLNESAMLVDGYLPASGLQGSAVTHRHNVVFDTERAAHGLGRVVAQLSSAPIPPDVRPLLIAALSGLDHAGTGYGAINHAVAVPSGAGELLAWLMRHEDDSQDTAYQLLVTRLYRFTATLGDLHRAASAWTTETADEPEQNAATSTDSFTPSISLVRGRLPGTHLLTGRALAASDVRDSWGFLGKIGSQTRIVIQALISLAIAVPLGDLISGQRYYWAMIGVMIMLTGTNSPHERVRKTIARVLGTAVGCTLGVVVCHLLKDNHPWVSLTLICAALTVGAYAVSTYYYIWGGALGFTLIQLYGWSTGFKDSVILIRAGENGLGGVIATLVALIVLPVATRTLLRRAQASHLRALSGFVRASGTVWSGDAETAGTRAEARAIDQANHELHAFTRSLLPVGSATDRDHARDVRATMQQAAHFAREMSVTGATADLTPDQRDRLSHVTSTMADSLEALANTVSEGTRSAQETWVRSGDELRSLQAELSAAASDSELRYALYYLGHLDDLLGDLAGRLGMSAHGTDHRSEAQLLGRELFAQHALRASAAH